MKKLDTTSLMIIIHYLNNYQTLQQIPFINKKLQDVLFSFKVNPEINQHVEEKQLKYFPNIQTLSCSMEDYIKFEHPQNYDLYRLRIESLSFNLLEPFLKKLNTLKIGKYNGRSPQLPKTLDLFECQFLKSFELNANDQVETIICPKNLTRLKIAECRNLNELKGTQRIEMLRLYDCKSISSIPSCELTRLEVMRCPMIQQLELKSFHQIEHVLVSGCSSLQSLHLPNSVTTLELDDCQSLTTLQLSNQLKRIQFYYCSSLKSLILPTTITSLQLTHFDQLETLENISNCNMLEVIKFNNCQKISEFVFPSSLTSFSLKKSLNTIDHLKLNHCERLQSVECVDCGKIQSIEMTNGIQTIFIENAQFLSSLSLPSSLTKVNLLNCPSLEVVKTNAECELILQHCQCIVDLEVPNIQKCLCYNCPMLSIEELQNNSMPIIELKKLLL